MGVAILSGVFAYLETRSSLPNGHSTEPASGISTPTTSEFLDAPEEALPSRFIATVGREETGRKLSKMFSGMGMMGPKVEIRAGEGNVEAVKEADVVLVWWVSPISRYMTGHVLAWRGRWLTYEPVQLEATNSENDLARRRHVSSAQRKARSLHLCGCDHLATPVLGTSRYESGPSDA